MGRRPDLVDEYLSAFTTTPAPQRGRAWLGLLAADESWLLFHEHDPGERLTVSLHGSPVPARDIVGDLSSAQN